MEVNPSSDLIKVGKKLADEIIELHGDELFNKFHVRLYRTHSLDENYVSFNVGYIGNKTCSLSHLQKYVDCLYYEKMASDKTYNEQLSCAGEDSSYDSDFEGSEETKHTDVSRTASDTLAEEFAEYVTVQVVDKCKALVEFGLKLGYTEQLIQTALQKLHPNPNQNELLAELIKLGAVQNIVSNERQLLLIHHAEEQPVENPVECISETTKFRPIVIDGSNVAMSHGNRETFSCRGIKICVDWFRSRGINELTVFVPKWRKESPRLDNPVVEQEILHELEKERLLVFTPSREVRGKRMVCYDDRYILKLASENDGIVVSNDNYRDLVQECPEFRKVVEERILMYTFVNDRFMPPDDPLGRSGPTLDNFLKIRPQRKAEICPYGKKCTYGNKCKYNHPERGVNHQHKSISDTLMEKAQKQLRVTDKKLKGKSLSLPLETTCTDEVANTLKVPTKKALSRAQSTSTFKLDNKECDNRGMHGVDELCYPCVRPTYVQQPQPLTVWQPPQWRPMYDSKNVTNNQPPDHSQRDTANNLHRKLQRQLSINPVCDPRIFQMQRNALQFASNHHHQPVSRNYSFQDSLTSNTTRGHLNVTRISSAPSSNENYPMAPDGSFISSSDPQLSHTLDTQSNNNNNNNCMSYNSLSMWPPITGQQTSATVFPAISNAEDTRRKIHYHLSSIFPMEQVDAVMQLYPNETNAQQICSLILSMFPSKLK